MVIAFVPVRIGSKSIPFKNIKSFCGKPLLFWMLDAMNKSSAIDKIVVASNSEQIDEVVNSFGLFKVEIYQRDEVNANDVSSTESVMLEYLSKNTFEKEDVFVLGQATNPFVIAQYFDEAIALFQTQKDVDSLLSCSRIKRFFWTEDGEAKNYDFNKRPRRQDFKGDLVENGAFYVNSIGNILDFKNRLSGKIKIYEMPEYAALELDEPVDWISGEYFMRKYLLSQNVSVKRDIKLVMSDIDGVLTDAGMYYSEHGDELKKFSTYDGMGFKILREKGLKVGVITGEDVQLNRKRAAKLQLDFQFHGNDTKLQTIQALIKDLGINIKQVAYIGDDINDKDLLEQVGYPACPKSASEVILNLPGITVLNKKGGEGAFREFSELILNEID